MPLEHAIQLFFGPVSGAKHGVDAEALVSRCRGCLRLLERERTYIWSLLATRGAGLRPRTVIERPRVANGRPTTDHSLRTAAIPVTHG